MNAAPRQSKLASTKKPPGANSPDTLPGLRWSANWLAIRVRRLSPGTPCGPRAIWRDGSATKPSAFTRSLQKRGEQREQRELVEFIERRGGTVTVREVTHYYWPAQRSDGRRQSNSLTALDKGGHAEMGSRFRHTEQGPTDPEFSGYYSASASAEIGNSPSIAGNYGDADAE